MQGKGAVHDYKFKMLFMRNSEFNNGVFTNLPKRQWKYMKVVMCSVCGHKKHIEITADEYKNMLEEWEQSNSKQ